MICNFKGRKKNFVGQNFWVQGYCVSTVGKDEDAVGGKFKLQEHHAGRRQKLQQESGSPNICGAGHSAILPLSRASLP